MDNALFVRGLEALRDLAGDGQRFIDRQRGAGDDARGEGLALNQFHDQRLDAVCFFEPEEMGDVGMIERGEHFGFTLESRESFVIQGDGGRQDLDGDVAPEPRIAGAIDLAHASRAELRDHFIRAEPGTSRQSHDARGLYAAARRASA